MPTHPRICVVGSANVDLTFRVSRFPRPGETLTGHTFQSGMGGKGANQAVAAARLGTPVTFVSRVGNDRFGGQAILSYQAEGIETAVVSRDGEYPTGTAAILVDDCGENCIVVVPGANARLSSADIQAATATLQQSAILLCQLETPIESTLEAFRIVRAAGARTILTPAPAQELPDELLNLCDVCVPNRTELNQLVADGGDIEAGARVLLQRGVRNVVVTMGGEGALMVNAREVKHIPALAVRPVDTTGAGDAFTAALAVYWSRGNSLEEAARGASRVAALTVTRAGAQSAFPTAAEVDILLANSGCAG